MKKILLFVILLIVINLFSTINYTFNNYQVSISGKPDYNLTIERSLDNDYYKIKMENSGYSTNPGEPEIPSYTKLVTLPETGNYKVDKISYDYEIQKLDKPLIAMGWEDNVELKNSSRNKWFANDVIKIDTPKIMRNYRFTAVTVFPFQYNRQKNELKILKDINISLKLDTSDNKNPLVKRSNLYSKSFYKMAKNNIIGIKDKRAIPNKNYLFIIDSNLHLTYLAPIIAEKRRLGFKVYTATMEEIGTEKEQIKSYIQDAYDSWEYPPENVILFGDTDGYMHVPAFYIDGTYTDYDITDLPYSLFAGDDYFPDVMLGRISVRTSEQLNTVISKITHYETMPDMSRNWFAEAIMCATADYGLYSAVNTKELVKEKLLNFGYQDVKHYYFPQQSNTQQLLNMINDGASLINYRGFGGAQYWFGGVNSIMLWNDDIPMLQNGFKLPLVTSIVCGGGDFAVQNCFGEVWLQTGTPTNPKGAIGFIGPSEHDTKTWFNNANDLGIYQGFTQEGINQCAAMMLRGKMELYRNFPYGHEMGNSHVSDQFYFYVYNLLGDPALAIWTDMPKEITSLDYDENITSADGNLEFTVHTANNDNKDFTVAITNSDSLFVVGYTLDNGSVNIPVILNEGEYTATISKYGYKPYTITFNVNNEDIKITNYNFDNILNSDEDFALNFTLKNISNNSISDINVTVNSPDNLFNITSSQVNIDQLDSNSSYEIQIIGNIANVWNKDIDTQIDIAVSFDATNLIFTIPATIHSPLLQTDFTDDFSIPTNSTYDFAINLKNIGTYKTGDFTGTLSSLNSNVEIISQNENWDNILANQNASVSYQIMINNVQLGEIAEFNLNLQQENNEIQNLHFTIPIGETDENSPTISYGYAALESNDANSFNNPIYEWIDINPSTGLSGTLIPHHNEDEDGYYSYMDLPFAVNYYGKEYDRITFCSNGWLAMGEVETNSFRNRTIPSGAGPAAMITPFWDNLINENAYKYYDETNDRFIIEWYNFSGNTFEVIFYPSENEKFSDILFQYKEIHDNDAENNYSTTGIENPEQTKGVLTQFAHIAQPTAHLLSNNYAILFTDVSNLGFPLVTTSPNNFNFSMQNGDTENFSITINNENNQKMMLNLIISYDNDRDWIISSSDTLSVDANSTGEFNFTLNPYYLEGGDYKAYINITTQYQQLISIPVNLEIATSSDENVIETSNGISKIYPSPFVVSSSSKSEITVQYSLSQKAKTEISIYNLKGEKVKTLINSVVEKGNHKAMWNGKNNRGKTASTGVYFYKMSINGKIKNTKKVLLIK